ncbi:hypothetical protein [Hyunsoonleella pacifica]|uniref:Uncharacterized protein n=1 Tax=Hyunsoonleella pacifica TaxID=1080224 RepID=A0A4Q9FRP2_9FLAO|nr:hypothetical protein [Hyunsoonleella pacifica]TBN17777.1 hypothetical protein EYD46_05550 [Hyunsoonleella pacifica]GGD09048.1 hypothetical protein GCM10011368_08730 [Hyunsoonleella pacifica]
MQSLYWVVSAVIVLAVLILFALEIIAKLNNVPNDNVNELIRQWAYDKYYFITFCFGVISGHLFLGITYRWFDCQTLGINLDCGIFDVLVIAVLVSIFLISGLVSKFKTSNVFFHFLLLICGLFAGHFIWSMNIFV